MFDMNNETLGMHIIIMHVSDQREAISITQSGPILQFDCKICN